ncbi:TIGR00730 family Rossman fold protein [Leptotrichia sp. OH3620_COT-345]|uniref:LOG family protein n=1 Tax=Leptotrichia sp. OH3620_COT-345 TaxID=2491048 RepID=UPI000F64EA40|nr:TIGR00730 family Rossman fold protein [Leptotrichia sp. OH3620_COT-345]RRD39319.1 TIGR00730 family Rossman fold protein [Leptotrichia sp. OH3620_COT-345]
MNITVYCGANSGNSEIYKKSAENFGNWIVKNNYSLIYGGGKSGLMGIIADIVLKGGCKAVGVMPVFLKEKEAAHQSLTEFITVNTMTERKKIMIERGEVYVALPGGPGTLEEISEVISWAKIGQNIKPCILFNINGYYDNLKNMYDTMVVEGFLTEEDRKKILFSYDFDEIEKFISEYEISKVK